MNLLLRPLLLVLLVGASSALTSCQYLYSYHNSGAFIPYRSAGRGPIGNLAASTLGSNRDHYYYVISGTHAGTRYYSARPYDTRASSRPAIYPLSYNLHPYYSNDIHSSPYYNRSPSNGSSFTNRPWGGGYGFGQPFNWGTGLGVGSRWF